MNRIAVTRCAIRCATAAIVAAAALMPVGCSTGGAGSGAEAPEDRMPPRGRIVFDMAHGQIFGAEDTSELGQSEAIAMMREAGYEVVINSDEITADDLAGASGLMLAGPMVPLREAEYEVITSFVQGGGTVLLTIHVPFPVLKVPAHWGLPVGTEIIMSASPLSSADPSVFVAGVAADSPLVAGVDEVLVVSGWPVTAVTPEAEVIVATGPDAWLTPANGAEPQGDQELTSYGVIGVTELGSGRIVVVGDDAVFANLALGEFDNARLLRNIIDLMTVVVEV